MDMYLSLSTTVFASTSPAMIIAWSAGVYHFLTNSSSVLFARSAISMMTRRVESSTVELWDNMTLSNKNTVALSVTLTKPSLPGLTPWAVRKDCGDFEPSLDNWARASLATSTTFPERESPTVERPVFWTKAKSAMPFAEELPTT